MTVHDLIFLLKSFQETDKVFVKTMDTRHRIRLTSLKSVHDEGVGVVLVPELHADQAPMPIPAARRPK